MLDAPPFYLALDTQNGADPLSGLDDATIARHIRSVIVEPLHALSKSVGVFGETYNLLRCVLIPSNPVSLSLSILSPPPRTVPLRSGLATTKCSTVGETRTWRGASKASPEGYTLCAWCVCGVCVCVCVCVWVRYSVTDLAF